MKSRLVLQLAAASLILAACDKPSPEAAKRLAELEQQAKDAVAKQRELEQRLAEQQIAAERDAIERERMQIEEDRLEMERQQGAIAAEEAARLTQRENELASREGKLLRTESDLDDQKDLLEKRGAELSERERELAGREALPSKSASPEPAPSAPVGDFGMFHDSLSPYGSWFETPDYGYVWQPVIVRDSGWRPYTRGRWVCTDRGWTWVSDEPFGWACYHYGRWALCRGFGWVWIPGSEWAPAWVSWRSSGSHIGWAPLPPETLAWRGHRWDSSVETTFGIGASWFTFVETQNFCDPIQHHYLPYTQNNIYIGQTVNITNIHIHDRHVICGGPRYSDIAIQTKRRPPFYRIEEDRHGRTARDLTAMRPRVEGDRLFVNAPNLDREWNDAIRPSRVKGRIDQFDIERQTTLKPEIADRFRKSREESRNRAETSIKQLGGREAFQQARTEQNRPGQAIASRVEESRSNPIQKTKNPLDIKPGDPRHPATHPEVAERIRGTGLRPSRPPQGTDTASQQPQISRAEETKPKNSPEQLGRVQQDLRRPGNNPEVVERVRESGIRPGQAQESKTPSRTQQPSRQEERSSQAQQQAERSRQQQMHRDEQDRARQQQEKAERERDQQQRNRQQQEQAERQRDQQERARQQQEQAERQREQQQRARQQQEQAERQREQQERARQQQEQAERQREQHERARQQQEQAERQREQQERSRQEQERGQRQREEESRKKNR